jgi:hypothetical protein
MKILSIISETGMEMGEGECTKCRKTVAESFTKDAKMKHREMIDICITVNILENQVNNMWNMSMICRSK